jgi:UDP-glucuronate 4-epimerase
MKVLVTGTAGFIGFHLARTLLARGDEVVGLDNLNEYYDPQLKYDRLAECGIAKEAVVDGKVVGSSVHPNYRFIKCDLQDKAGIDALFEQESFDAVCHLAAQAGVRYSIDNPYAYIESNVVGFMNVLEACRHFKVTNLSYASSSSVYGLNEHYPFSTSHNVDHPVSLYAATKKSNELMAHTYSHLYGIQTTGLRFFTVYGPWGRPDMAYYMFTKAAFEGNPIDVFNNGEMMRDFTYIDDIIDGVVRVVDHPATAVPAWDAVSADPATSSAPYRVYNIGNSQPVKLMRFIEAIEQASGKTMQKRMLPFQPGDVQATYADVTALVQDLGYHPATDIDHGIGQFVSWYRAYYLPQ